MTYNASSISLNKFKKNQECRLLNEHLAIMHNSDYHLGKKMIIVDNNKIQILLLKKILIELVQCHEN